MLLDGFVDLNRVFYEISDSSNPDDVDTHQLMGRLSMGKRIHWADILKEYRSVILAEAGSGKTWEIYQAATKIKADGKVAFFLRLEHLADDLETAFEVGTYAEFQSWLSTNAEGWIFLDSIDESRLKDPKDFERAIKKIAMALGSATERAHRRGGVENASLLEREP